MDRQFKACKPNQFWVMDKTMTKELVISALKMAYKRQKPGKGVIHHSDRGVQYVSYE
ncbi:transposase InsO family protein [Neobacillus sp. B4I6]